MELLSLVATLTLDAKDYDKGMEDAQKTADGFTVPTPAIPKPDTSGYKEGLKEAEEDGNLFKDVMKGVWEGVKDAIVSTSIVATITGIIGYLKQGINLAVKNGDQIAKESKNLQLSTRAYQEYEYVLGKSNIKVSALSKAMTELDKIRAGKGSDDQIAYLEALGIDAEAAKNGLISTETLLNSVMNALANYSGSDKGAIIDAFFGNNKNWTGFFSQTSKEIQDLKDEAEDFGFIMSDEAVKNAEAYSDAMENLSTRLEAIQRSFGEGILPVITEAVNKLMLIVDFFTGSDKRTSTEKFADLDSKYEAQLNELKAKAITAETLSKTLLGMGDTSGMDARQLAIWKGTAQSLIEMIPTLSGVIDVENGTISESAEGIGELIKQYIALEKETAYQTSKAERQNVIDQKSNELTEKAVLANNRLAEAEGKRNEAIDAYNKVLGKYGHEELDYTATLEDINKAKTEVLNSVFGGGDSMAEANQELSDAIKPLTTLIGEAQKAQSDVDALTADIAAGEEALSEWVGSEGAMYENISSSAQQAQADVDNVTDALNNVPSDVYSAIHITTDGDTNPASNAKGNWRVPYDNFPALLHRDEMVLNKSQARQFRDGVGGYGAGIGDMIGSSVEQAMSRVYVMLSGEKVGDLTTKRIDKNINAKSYSKLRAMGG